MTESFTTISDTVLEKMVINPDIKLDIYQQQEAYSAFEKLASRKVTYVRNKKNWKNKEYVHCLFHKKYVDLFRKLHEPFGLTLSFEQGEGRPFPYPNQLLLKNDNGRLRKDEAYILLGVHLGDSDLFGFAHHFVTYHHLADEIVEKRRAPWKLTKADWSASEDEVASEGNIQMSLF